MYRSLARTCGHSVALIDAEEENRRTITKVSVYLVVLAVVDTVIPLPITAGLLLYVVLERPAWFRDLVNRVYGA